MKLNIFSRLIFAALLAFTVSSFVYFSFGNIYSSTVLSYASFEKQFHSGIYQYRLLSGWFLIWIYDFLSILDIDYQVFKFKFYHPDSESQMYLALYVLNTVFLILSAILLVLITETKNFVTTPSEKILLTAVMVFTVGFSQFVIVPYDVSGYFFILLFFFYFIQYIEKPSTDRLLIPAIIIAVSTLNRESSALSVSLAATMLFARFRWKKETIFPIIIFTLVFLAVYLGMRVFNESFSTNDGNLMLQNFTDPKNLLGLLFWLVLLLLSLMTAKDRKTAGLIWVFHLFAAPYLMMCFYSGIIYEFRLYMPLFITSLLIGRTEIRYFQ